MRGSACCAPGPRIVAPCAWAVSSPAPPVPREEDAEERLRYNEEVIAEKEQDMTAIQRTVVDVADVVNQLSRMVHEHAPVIGAFPPPLAPLPRAHRRRAPDDIESSLETSTRRASSGLGNVQRSEEHQGEARDKLCMLLGCLLLALATILLYFRLFHHTSSARTAQHPL